MNVSVTIPTRGDVDLQPVIDSFPPSWEIVIWDNSPIQTAAPSYVLDNFPRVRCVGPRAQGGSDLSVYGRYAAIEHATHDLILTQDDDVIVDAPEAIFEKWMLHYERLEGSRLANPADHVHFVVANMPPEFLHAGYTDSCLLGFGACFHRDLPRRAFKRFLDARIAGVLLDDVNGLPEATKEFHRTCDVVFTTLTPRILVDVPKQDREFASDPNRMWKQPSHFGERQEMLRLARQVRDA